jgi:heptose-I-phosphate ethanolaminephosphotransferase
MNETNDSEVSGFVSTYFTSAKFYFLVFLYILIAAAEVFCLRRATDKELKLGKMKWIAIPTLIIMLCQVFFFSTDYEQNYRMAKGTPIKRNMLWKLEQSALMFQENQKDFTVCAKSIENATVDSCAYRSPNIIIIIGEAYIKHHSSLYGYGKETNPLLSKEDYLYVFNDVIAPYNNTSESFKNFLSMASMDDSIKWCEAPLFPALFRKAGYHVTFYSNQFVKGGAEESRFDAKAGFFSHPAIEPNIIDSRNSERYPYDGELISQYMKDHQQKDTIPYHLTFFHLYGQHVKAKDRYPKEFEHFHASDYPERTDLNESQRQEVAEYDNATRYNDYIVHEIINLFREQDAIVIYFSDHGDEANDYRPQLGRSYDFDKMGSKGIHCQYDIPFVIYVTDSYKQHHPEIVQEIISSTDRRFMTDDLPHLVLYLAGIDCRWYQPQRNLISPDFKTDRQRHISAGFDYDEFCRLH